MDQSIRLCISISTQSSGSSQSIGTPYIIGGLNDNFVKIAKVKGEFVWHHHEFEDEMFVVLEGTLMMDFRDKTVSTRPGEILIVPKGVEHRPWTENGQEVKLMLVEPKVPYTPEIRNLILPWRISNGFDGK